MTMRELDRFKVIQDVTEGRLKPWRAAERLGLTTRQVRRLVARYRESEGAVQARDEAGVDRGPGSGVVFAHATDIGLVHKELRAGDAGQGPKRGDAEEERAEDAKPRPAV